MRSVYLLALSSLLFLARTSAAQGVAVRGTLEHYVDTTLSDAPERTALHARWLRLETELSPALRLVTGSLRVRRGEMLDENYLEARAGSAVARVGRFRAAFGQNSWDDCYYRGLGGVPWSRYAGALRLSRIDTGADLRLLWGSAEVTVAALDARSTPWRLLPERLTHGALRVQVPFRSLVVAGNVLTNGASERLYAVDARWTMPHLTLLSEVFTGTKERQRFRASYVDAIWRLPGKTRTSLVARAEQRQKPVLGVRQIVSPAWEARLLHGGQGWMLQSVSNLRF